MVYGFEDYYWPKGISKFPTPEDIRIVKEMPENKICEECNKPIWSCYCMI